MYIDSIFIWLKIEYASIIKEYFIIVFYMTPEVLFKVIFDVYLIKDVPRIVWFVTRKIPRIRDGK